MENSVTKIIFLILLWVQSSNAQIKVEPDSIKLSNNNCATRLTREYILKMSPIEGFDSKEKPLKSSELLKGSEFEKETNGVFIISTLSSHRRKLIILKKGNQIKLLTFNDVGNSMIDLILFLKDIKSSDEKLINYIDSIQLYIQNSKKLINTNNKIGNSNWLNCE